MQGRHPRQTSDALGSAASQLGPRALALATQLNKGLGLPYGKTTTVLQQAFGLQVSRGGLCQALARVASKAEPTYKALVEEVRRSASVTPDETGWRVDGKLWWMWAFSTPQVTVYSIQPGRGFEQAAVVLGADFAGFLVRDGWSIYLRPVSCWSDCLTGGTDQTVRPIARSLRGWSGEATDRSKPSDNVPTRARVAPEP